MEKPISATSPPGGVKGLSVRGEDKPPCRKGVENWDLLTLILPERCVLDWKGQVHLLPKSFQRASERLSVEAARTRQTFYLICFVPGVRKTQV